MKRTVIAIAAALAAVGTAHAETTPQDSCKLTTREVVTQFFNIFYLKKEVRKAFETWVVPNYIQHNPSAATGRDAAIAFLEPFFADHPDASYSIKRILVDGDMAAVQSQGKLSPKDRGIAIVDIVRVENCKVVEHWDVVQPVPEKSMNNNGMF